MTRQQRRYAERQAAKDAKRKPQKFRRGASDYTPLEITLATLQLMTGERAQKPSWAAVRKVIRWMRHWVDLGLQPPMRHARGSWRSWPKNQGQGLEAING